MTQLHPFQNEETMLVTTNVWHRKPVFLNQSFAREAVECMYRVQELHPFLLYGFVIMPDHCHFLVQVPAPNTVSKVMNSYKSGLVFDLGLKKLWQRRFHLSCVDNAYEALRYIHLNPVRAGLAENIYEYPWSSGCGKWDISPLILD